MSAPIKWPLDLKRAGEARCRTLAFPHEDAPHKMPKDLVPARLDSAHRQRQYQKKQGPRPIAAAARTPSAAAAMRFRSSMAILFFLL